MMREKQTELPTSQPVHIRLRDDARSLIDRAAKAKGKNRSEFMIEAAVAAAEDTLLDQTLVKVDQAAFDHYVALLDQPPNAEGFARLMNAPKPWAS